MSMNSQHCVNQLCVEMCSVHSVLGSDRLTVWTVVMCVPVMMVWLVRVCSLGVMMLMISIRWGYWVGVTLAVAAVGDLEDGSSLTGHEPGKGDGQRASTR